MQTITIEILSKDVLAILQQLEKMQLLRISEKEGESSQHTNVERKWAGTISKETGAKMLEYVSQIRSEWDRNI